MQTKLIKIDADDPNKEDMREAAEIIRSLPQIGQIHLRKATGQ